MNLKEVSTYDRCVIAVNKNTPPEVLARLANDVDHHVRYHVAKNPNTLPETLDRLVDEFPYNVAINPNTPQYLKEYLTAVMFMVNCYGS